MLLAFAAGVLSILSPCVLPLVPVVLAGAVAEHRLAPLALALGLAISFTAIGVFVSTVGFSLGLDMETFRIAAAVLLVAFGVLLMMPATQMRLAAASGPIADLAQQRFGRFSTDGVAGQFGVGLLLGAVWTPCVGPTLGAASVMAVRGENLGSVILTMLAFGVGISVPLLLLGAMSREAIARMRGRLLQTGTRLKAALGLLLIAAGVATLTGWDRAIQTAIEQAMPDWLLAIATRI